MDGEREREGEDGEDGEDRSLIWIINIASQSRIFQVWKPLHECTHIWNHDWSLNLRC